MSRSHRVWNDVRADNYTTSKSFGGEFRQSIKVGSSASYSNAFAEIEVRELALPAGYWSEFALYVNDLLVKRAVFNNKTKAYRVVEDGESCDDAIAAVLSA